MASSDGIAAAAVDSFGTVFSKHQCVDVNLTVRRRHRTPIVAELFEGGRSRFRRYRLHFCQMRIMFPHPAREICASVCLEARHLIEENIHSFILAKLEFGIDREYFAVESHNSTAKLLVPRCHVGDAPRSRSILLHALDQPG